MLKIYALHVLATNAFYPNDNDALALYSDLIWTPLDTDRFGFLNQYSNWNLGQSDNIFDLKSDISSSDEKFKEIFFEQIDNIVKRCNTENLNIYVMWSGGVDSTAIVCGLLQSDIDKSKITILHTSDSIEEYPLFYKLLQKNNIKCVSLDEDKYTEIHNSSINDGLLVTGWCADQLFGSIINQNYPDFFNKSYKDWITYYSKESEKNWNSTIEQFENAFEYYKIPVKSFPEWTWFMNFAVKWNFIKIQPYAMLGKYSDRVINFFDTIDFQKWSLNDFNKLSVLNQTIPNEYKLPLKKIIEEYTKDKDYTKNKKKIGSYGNLIRKTSTIKIALLDDEGYKFYSPNKPCHPERIILVEKRVLSKFIHNYRKGSTEI